VRWILAAYFCLLPAVVFIPWTATLQIHRALDFHDSASAVSITLDANRKITFTPTPSYPKTGKPVSVTLRIPIDASNLGPGNLVNIDRVQLHLLDPQRVGREAASLDQGLAGLYPFAYILDRSSDPGRPSPEIVLTVPFDAFNSARAAQSQIELLLLATKLRLAADKPLRSLAGAGIDEYGRCNLQDSIRFGHSNKMVYCVSTRPIGNCVHTRDPSRPLRNPEMAAFRCMGTTYAPWPLPLWRDAYYTVTVGSADDWQQPVRTEPPDETKKSDLIVSNYVPDVHFLRTFAFQMGSAIERPRVESQSADGVGPAARFASPAGVVADRRGNLFIVDQADSVIRKVSPSGEVSTFAGMAQQTGRNDGPGRDARFANPHGVAIDGADNLFVADSGNGLIRKITPAGVVSTLMGITGGQGNLSEPLRFKNPRGVVWASDGSIYVIDSNAVNNGNPLIRKVSPAGVVSTVAGPDVSVDGPGLGGIVLGIPAEEVLEN
jgi:hypothetical protein